MQSFFWRVRRAVFLVGIAFLVFLSPANAANNEQSVSVVDGPFSLSSAWGGVLDIGSEAVTRNIRVAHVIGTVEPILTLLPSKALTFSYNPALPSAVLDGGIFSNNPLIGEWTTSLSDRSSCSASPSVFSVGPDQYAFVLCGTKPSVSLVSNNPSVMNCSGVICTAVAPGSARITAMVAGTPIAIFGNKSGESDWLRLLSTTLSSATLSWDVSVVSPPTLSFSMGGTNPIPNNTSTTLSWNASNVIANNPCQASGDWSGIKDASGTFDTGNLQARRDYTLKCMGPSGDTVEGTVTVLVGSAILPPQFTFSSTALSVPYNTGATLSWIVSNPADTAGCDATGDWVSPGPGLRPLLGSQSTGNLTRTSSPYVYILSCSGPGGSQAKQISIQVVPPPSSPDFRIFEANPDHILYAGSTTIDWDVRYANQCTASTDSMTPIANWNGLLTTSGSRMISGLTKTTEFRLSCTGTGGTTDDALTVRVEPQNLQPPAISYFYADNPNLNYNQSTTLRWKVDRADWCEASGGWDWWTDVWFTDTDDTGNLVTSQDYVLRCGNLAGEVEQTVHVSVGDPTNPVTISFTADPYTVDYGSTTHVTWNSTNAQWCYLDWWQGGVYQYRVSGLAFSGDEWWGNMTASEVDVITCGNSLGSKQASISININPDSIPLPPDPGSFVNPPTISFTRDANFVSYNTSTTLRWSVTDADSCEAWNDQGLVSWDGPKALSGSATTGNLQSNTYFYLECTGPGGTSEANVYVRVGSSSEPGPTLSFWADDFSILSGQSTALHWISKDATSCVASGDWSGSKTLQSPETPPTIGFDTGALTSSKSYRLRCSNAVGSVLATVNVVVGGSPLLPAMSFYADDTLVPLGGSTILRWNTENVTSCVADSNPLSPLWTGSVSLVGGVSTGTLSGAGEYVYTLTCTNGLSGFGNTVSMKAHIFVGVAFGTGPVPTLFAEATTVQAGTSPILHYSSDYASQCSLRVNGGVPTVLPFLVGVVTADPIYSNTTYTLTCFDADGITSSSAVLSVDVGDIILCPNIAGQALKPGDTLSFYAWYVENSSALCSTVAALGGIDVTNAAAPSEVKWEVVSGGIVFIGPGKIQAIAPGVATIRVSYRPGSGTTWFSKEASLLVGRPIDCYQCDSSSASCRGEIQYDLVNDPAQCSLGTLPSRAACEISCGEQKWEEVAP